MASRWPYSMLHSLQTHNFLEVCIVSEWGGNKMKCDTWWTCRWQLKIKEQSPYYFLHSLQTHNFLEVRIVSEWGGNTSTWNVDDQSSVSRFILFCFSYFILFEFWLFLGYHMWYYWFQTFHKWISTLPTESRIIFPAAVSLENAILAVPSTWSTSLFPCSTILKSDNFYRKCVTHYLILKDIFSGLVLGFAVVTFNNYNLVFLVNLLSEAYLKQSWQVFSCLQSCEKYAWYTFSLLILEIPERDFENTTGESFWEYDQWRDRAVLGFHWIQHQDKRIQRNYKSLSLKI